jgi:hypothetical protein
MTREELQRANQPIIPVRGAWYSTDETAAILKVKRETLEIWRTTNRYPALVSKKAGHKVLYSGDTVLDFINGPHVPAAPYTPKNPRPKPAPRRKRIAVTRKRATA